MFLRDKPRRTPKVPKVDSNKCEICKVRTWFNISLTVSGSSVKTCRGCWNILNNNTSDTPEVNPRDVGGVASSEQQVNG